MKRKKLMSLLLTAAMTLSLAGCGGTAETAAPEETAPAQESTSASEGVNESQEEADGQTADPFGKYEEPLEVHFVRATDDTIETNVLANLPDQTLEDNFWLDTYEEELGIKVVYDW